MRRQQPAVTATQALLAVAAPAIAGAAQRPGKALPAGVTTLLTSYEGQVRRKGPARVLAMGSERVRRDRAEVVSRSTAVALNRLPQQTGKQ